MIGELIVRSGKLQLGHMAGDAILIGNGAVFGASMTGQTFAVVKRIRFDDLLVNVVTGDATNAFV
jgi:hypothetical protein